MGLLTGIPCAEDVEKKITDLAVAAIFLGLKYMFRYKSLVNDLDSEFEKLNNVKEKLSRRVQDEKDNGKFINNDVMTWQTKVEEIQKKGKVLSPSFTCIQCLPIPNPVSRLRMGREAVKKSETVTELIASGMQLSDKNNDIAYHPQRSEDVPNTNAGFHDFRSRQEAYGKLWNQLVSEDFLILGIYGMPGVGKTRMMKQIQQEAQEKKIFDKVTLAVVGSVTFDVIKLQDQLASNLRCNLESKDDKRKRADQLKNSMMNSGKILVIFDDVWGEISLSEIIGTSFQDANSWKGCKILFTSRGKSHCLDNNCTDPVKITILHAEEALDMFMNSTLGSDQIDNPPDESLMQQVCTKCAGLPLMIHAVGKALKLKSARIWKDALRQLEDCKIASVVGIDPKVYGCLKLSFDNIPDDAKRCLLLCSLLNADTSIYINKLVDIAAGSQLVCGGRTKVCAMVDTLRSASLLLEGEGTAESFRLHNIIRDVARSIAVKDHAFLIERCGRRLPGNSADYGAGKIWHLELEKNDFHFPPGLICPDLHTIWLAATTEQHKSCKVNIPKFPGEMFLNLRFLVLERLYWQHQFYLPSLNKLKTLLVVGCNLVHTDATYFPKSLETLHVWNCDLPTNVDFSKLTNLRKLEIHGGNDLQMVPNTISSLSHLKELHLKRSSSDDSIWTSLPKLNEISKLTCLTSLEIYWPGFEPNQDTSIFCELENFDIRVGALDRGCKPVPDVSTTKQIELSGKLHFEGFENLVERAERVILRNTNLNISTIWNSNREAFKDLKKLYIVDSDTIEYLARISLYEIQCIPRKLSSFSNLTSLGISNCSAMKYLFNNFVAERLVQLEELYIANCDSMEVIVMDEGKCDGDLTKFSKLKSLKLLSLLKLKSFYGKKRDMHSSSTLIMDDSAIPFVQPRPLFDGMVAFPSLEVLKVSNLDDTVGDIWGKNYYNNGNVSSSFWKLKSLKVSMCSGLKNVFHHSPMASHLIMHLKKINVSRCKMMREIIGPGEREEIIDDGKFGIIVFPELTKLKLVGLPDLSSSWCCQSGEANTYKVKFPVLLKLKLKDLKIDLEEIELGRDDSTCQLKYLNFSCNKEIQLPSAWQLQLYDLESLTMGHCLSYVLKSRCFKRLMVLKVTELECSTLFSLSVLTSLQQLQELKISNCGSMEKFLEDTRGGEVSDMDKNIIPLPHLRLVTLTDLPNLNSFIYGDNYELHMPSLKRVEVDNCGLSTLFTCSVFQNLPQLDQILVSECKFLESIVVDSRGNGTSDTKNITLPQLSAVILVDLPNLQSFSPTVSYGFTMPKLICFRLFRCPRMENFTSLKTNIGLVKVSFEWPDEKEVSDLNNYIKQYRQICAKHQPLYSKRALLLLCLYLPSSLLIHFMLKYASNHLCYPDSSFCFEYPHRTLNTRAWVWTLGHLF